MYELAAKKLRSTGWWRLLLLATGMLIMAACGGSISFSIGGESVEDAAEDLIEGELADGLGLGELSAACEDVDEPQVGSKFSCLATTENGQVVKIDGEVDREDHINLLTSNYISVDGLRSLETIAEESLREQNGLEVIDDAIDCGNDPIVFGDDAAILCAITDPTGAVFDFHIRDIVTQPVDFNYEIGDQR